MADQLHADLERFEIADQLRVARNLAVALGCLGKDQLAIVVSLNYYERSEKLDLPQWQYDFALTCCCSLVNLEDFEQATVWHDRCADLRGRAHVPQTNYSHVTSGLDIAIHSGDNGAVEACLQNLSLIQIGSSIRCRSAIRGYRLRVAQMDRGHSIGDQEVVELRQLFSQVKHLTGGDCLAIALCEALFRKGAHRDLKELLDDYVGKTRRETGPLPSALSKFL
jgi:hypothetical protein